MRVYKFHLGTGAVISALILLVGHYFPWHKVLPGGQPLDRIWAYRYGSTACWAGFTYWRWLAGGDKVTPLGLMLIYIMGGITTQAAYWLDAKGQEKTVARRQSEEIEMITFEDAYPQGGLRGSCELFAEQK